MAAIGPSDAVRKVSGVDAFPRQLRRGPRWFDVLASMWSALAAHAPGERGRRHRDMSTREASASTLPPTEEHPERGTVAVGDAVLTMAEYFVEDGIHTMRSVEFDVTAHADSLDQVVAMLVDNAEDYCSYLAELAGQQKATTHELETVGLLVPRIIAVRRERERELEEMTDMLTALVRRIRKKDPPRPTWRRTTTPVISSELSSG